MKQYLLLLTLFAGLSGFAYTPVDPVNPFLKELKSVLHSTDVQAFFGESAILIYKTEDLCAKLDCASFELDSGQEVVFASREDLFMMGSPKYMEVIIVDKQQDDEIVIRYALRGQVTVKK